MSRLPRPLPPSERSRLRHGAGASAGDEAPDGQASDEVEGLDVEGLHEGVGGLDGQASDGEGLGAGPPDGEGSHDSAGAHELAPAERGDDPMPSMAVVVVDHDAGPVLADCLRSLAGEPVDEVVVVDNGGSRGTGDLADVPTGLDGRLHVVRTGTNLGYGAGANRGVAATTAELVVVANPDIEVHPGALRSLATELAADPTVGVVGPRIDEPDGRRYPSARRFPSPVDAAGHALLGRVAPGNRFSRRYRMDDLREAGAATVDWVSGACFATRRRAWEELGGFDEGYFMYAEDMDLCWRAARAGWIVRYRPDAVVTHLQGVSTRRHPYAMLLAHHRSALRFTWRTASGWRRALVVPAVAVLSVRFVTETVRLVVAGPWPALTGGPRAD